MQTETYLGKLSTPFSRKQSPLFMIIYCPKSTLINRYFKKEVQISF